MKPLASIQVDLDSFWTLEEFWGLPQTPRACSLYAIALPRFLELFRTCGVRATLFVVGRDLEHPAHADLLKDAIADGHEIANHSMHHRFGFARLHPAEQAQEILEADRLIQHHLGLKPVGFRAPGYSVSGSALGILKQHGYLYDASLLPSFFNPLMSWVHQWRARPHRVAHSDLGGWRAALAPSTPYYPDQTAVWRPGPTDGLLELPLAVTPLVRLPFYANAHLSSGRGAFRASLSLFRTTPVNYLFHLIELAAPEEIGPSLWRHPNARLPLARKQERCQMFLDELARRFQLVPAKELANAWRSNRKTQPIERDA